VKKGASRHASAWDMRLHGGREEFKFLSRARPTWTDWRTPPAAEPGARRCPSTEIGKCDPIFYHQTDARCDLISEIMP